MVASDVLSRAMCEQWAQRGFVSVEGLFDPQDVAQAAKEVSGIERELSFPNREAPATNLLALSPRLARAAEQLLGSQDIRLFESQVVPARGGTASAPLAQMHSTHSLLTPPKNGSPEAVHVVVFLGSEGAMTLRADGTELAVHAAPGKAVLFRSDLFQRVEGPTQRIGLRPAKVDWVHGGNGAGFGNTVSGMPRNWVAELTTAQRTLFGFPPPGNAYWTDDTIAAVRDHYAAAVSGWSGPEGKLPAPMDMSDYIEAQTNHTPALHSLTPSVTPEAARPTLLPLPDRWAHKKDTLWATPEPTLGMSEEPGRDSTMAPVLSDAQVQAWHREGYLVVHGLFPAKLVETAVAAAHQRWEQGASLGGFPFAPELDAFNQIALHPRLLKAAEQCLGTDDLRLCQSGLMDKAHAPALGGARGERSDFAPGEQGLHQDYSNNTLVVPPRPPQLPETLNCIVYYSHNPDCGGATTAVPFSATNQAKIPRTYSVVDDWPIRRSKQHALYTHERAVEYRPGTALLYRMDTFHRGTPLKPGGRRLTHHLVIKRASAEWMGSNSFVTGVAHRSDLVARLSPWQRQALGIPMPRNPYWTDETVALLRQRYPELADADAYKVAVAKL